MTSRSMMCRVVTKHRNVARISSRAISVDEAAVGKEKVDQVDQSRLFIRQLDKIPTDQ